MRVNQGQEAKRSSGDRLRQERLANAKVKGDVVKPSYNEGQGAWMEPKRGRAGALLVGSGTFRDRT